MNLTKVPVVAIEEPVLRLPSLSWAKEDIPCIEPLPWQGSFSLTGLPVSLMILQVSPGGLQLLGQRWEKRFRRDPFRFCGTRLTRLLELSSDPALPIRTILLLWARALLELQGFEYGQE